VFRNPWIILPEHRDQAGYRSIASLEYASTIGEHRFLVLDSSDLPPQPGSAS